MQFDQQERQCLHLLHVKSVQRLRASQDDQRGEKQEAVDRPNSASHEGEERCKEREAPVHRLEQVVEEKRIDDIQEREDVACDSQPKQRLVRQDIVRRSRGVVRHDETTAHDRGESRRGGDPRNHAGHPGLDAWRHCRKPFPYASIFCTLLWAACLDPSLRVRFHTFPPRCCGSVDTACSPSESDASARPDLTKTTDSKGMPRSRPLFSNPCKAAWSTTWPGSSISPRSSSV